MDRHLIGDLAHADHPVAAPLDDDTVDRLLAAALDGQRSVLDLGCGEGTWLLRALRSHPDLTVEAAASHLRPGGRLLVGECSWERPPSAQVLQALGAAPDDYRDLSGTVEAVRATGWEPLHGHVSSQQEWDAYEWSWTGSLTRWALEHPEHPSSAEVLEVAAQHRAAWLGGCRGTLGFLTLLLAQRPTG